MRLPAVLFSKMVIKSAIQATEKEIEVKAPWGKITALTWGCSLNPPVFLCHGRLDSCTSFRRLVHHLPEDNFYVSVDLPGNGRSDPLPRGARYSKMDFVPTLDKIQEHFEWEKFVFIGHSLGAALGKYYNNFYPGRMTRIVELDPQPAYRPLKADLRSWYSVYYEQFYNEFSKYSGDIEAAPKYTYEEVRKRIMKARDLDQEAADDILERCLAPAGEGLYRITFDQRMKILGELPISMEAIRELYTASDTPILAIFASESVEQGFFKKYPFALDDRLWPNKNYKSTILGGGHDIHLQKTSEVARLIIEFLNEEKIK